MKILRKNPNPAKKFFDLSPGDVFECTNPPRNNNLFMKLYSTYTIKVVETPISPNERWHAEERNAVDLETHCLVYIRPEEKVVSKNCELIAEE